MRDHVHSMTAHGVIRFLPYPPITQVTFVHA